MNIVIVGHVDHGKSTLIGRLLADTNSLPDGKLEKIKNICERNSKPFEYAFLLDALDDEQSQGITIDTARTFFKTGKREYIIIDAPGHIEFLKNMISGASRAEAAVLIIDAHEGIAENSKRHAYMLSLLGIKQVIVAVNKMDLAGYDVELFHAIKREFSSFLKMINISPIAFIPISARNGENVVHSSVQMNWYDGFSIVQAIDEFEKEKDDSEKPFRMYTQGVYKFNGHFNGKRIIVGNINSGKLKSGDNIVFLPSGKKNTVKSIEVFNQPDKSEAASGEAIGITLDEEIYLKTSELIAKTDEETPKTTDRFRANIFWMGKNRLEIDKEYKLKIGTCRTTVRIEEIESVIDASSIEKFVSRRSVNKNEVAQCILKTRTPLSFDLISENKETSRFVIIDGYDIAGGGIIIGELRERTSKVENLHEFEKELHGLIRKLFPHWELKPILEISD